MRLIYVLLLIAVSSTLQAQTPNNWFVWQYQADLPVKQGLSQAITDIGNYMLQKQETR